MKKRGFACATLLFSALTAAPAAAQVLGQAPDDSVSFWRVAGSLLLCIGLGVGAVLALRKRAGGGMPVFPGLVRKERQLKLIEVLRLNQHVDLCLVACDDKTMLLAASAHGVDVLPYGSSAAPQMTRPGASEADS